MTKGDAREITTLLPPDVTTSKGHVQSILTNCKPFVKLYTNKIMII